jgi:hypothetical protein
MWRGRSSIIVCSTSAGLISCPSSNVSRGTGIPSAGLAACGVDRTRNLCGDRIISCDQSFVDRIPSGIENSAIPPATAWRKKDRTRSTHLRRCLASSGIGSSAIQERPALSVHPRSARASSFERLESVRAATIRSGSQESKLAVCRLRVIGQLPATAGGRTPESVTV